MRVEHQLKAFEQILSRYDGSLPLHRFLPAYYKQNKQMGSSDRRWATRHIYSFYRLGKALPKLSVEERLSVAEFLCHDTLSPVVEKNLSKFVAHILLPLENKLKLVEETYPDFNLEDVFPFNTHLSEGISKIDFYTSFF